MSFWRAYRCVPHWSSKCPGVSEPTFKDSWGLPTSTVANSLRLDRILGVFLFKFSLMPHKLLHALQWPLDIINNMTKPEANGMVAFLTKEWEPWIPIIQDGW